MTESFKVLMQNTPVESLQEALNYIFIYYNFLQHPVENSDSIFSYHKKYMSSVKEDDMFVFLIQENLI